MWNNSQEGLGFWFGFLSCPFFPCSLLPQDGHYRRPESSFQENLFFPRVRALGRACVPVIVLAVFSSS